MRRTRAQHGFMPRGWAHEVNLGGGLLSKAGSFNIPNSEHIHVLNSEHIDVPNSAQSTCRSEFGI